MTNTTQKNGVRFNDALLARLQIYWFKNDVYQKNWGWIRWRTKLLSGELAKANPVQINSEIHRKARQCKQA